MKKPTYVHIESINPKKKKTFACLFLLISWVLFPNSLHAGIYLSEEVLEQILPDHVLECKDIGYNKLFEQAESYGIEVDMSTFTIESFSNTILAKYIHWSVKVTDIRGREDLFGKNPDDPVLREFTQKPLLRKCF